MTAMIPRRKRPTPTARLRDNLKATPRLAEGQSKSLRPVQRAALGAVQTCGIEVVEHGGDPDVPRPAVVIVMWVGAATPTNAVDYDFWFPATI